MVEMGVSDENEINVGKVFDIDPRIPMAFQRPHPFRPDRVNERVEAGRSNQETGVADPDDFDFILGEIFKYRGNFAPGRFSFSDD
jgi:hypothetical protein